MGRRFGGMDSKRASDGEVVERYTNIVKKLGGKANARWHYSSVTYDGNKYNYLDWNEKVTFSSNVHTPIPKGYVLNSITIVGYDENNNEIMLSDLAADERQEYLKKYIDKLVLFIKNIINK